MPHRSLVNVLARSFLAGEPAVEQMVARGARTLGRRWRWLRPLVVRYVESVAGRIRPRHRDVVQFLRSDAGFERAQAKYSYELSVAEWLAQPQQMQPVPAAEAWNLPPIESAGALADWLGLTPGELLWFADPKRLGYKEPFEQLRHYLSSSGTIATASWQNCRATFG